VKEKIKKTSITNCYRIRKKRIKSFVEWLLSPLNNVKIFYRIFIFFLAMILLFSLIMIISLNITSETYNSAKEYNNTNINTSQAIIEIVSSLNRLEVLLHKMIEESEEREILELYSEINENEKSILSNLHLVETLFEGDPEKIIEFREVVISLQHTYNLIEHSLLENTDQLLSELVNQATYITGVLSERIQEILLISEITDKNIIKSIEDNYNKQRNFLVFTGIGAIILELIFAYILAGTIYKPMRKVINEIGKAKNTAYEPKLDIYRKDEIGSVSNAFIEMLDHVRESNKQILNLEAIARNNQKMESLGVMASGIAHEINNPITGILGYGQLIMDMQEEGSDTYKFSEEIIKEVNRVSYIVQNLLHFSRHKYSAHSKVNLKEIVDNALVLISFLIRKDRIQINLDFEDDSVFIDCSEQEIQQVLTNLILNSRDALNAKYNNETNVKEISIKSYAIEIEAKKWIRLEIEDNGKGIPAEYQNVVFDPFFTTKSDHMGTGLGLSISYGIVKKHNGEIYFESEASQYTKFYIEFPVSER